MFGLFRKKHTDEADLKCPRCGIVMKKINKSGVVIDICPKCNGMWLDDDEIGKLIKHGGKNVKTH